MSEIEKAAEEHAKYCDPVCGGRCFASGAHWAIGHSLYAELLAFVRKVADEPPGNGHASPMLKNEARELVRREEGSR